MKNKYLTYLLFFYWTLMSCSGSRSSQICFKKQQLKDERFSIMIHNQKIRPSTIKSFEKVENKCIGLYIITYKTSAGLFLVPALQFNSDLAIYSDIIDTKDNDAAMTRFKSEYLRLFTKEQMRSIEERFSKGKIFVGSN